MTINFIKKLKGIPLNISDALDMSHPYSPTGGILRPSSLNTPVVHSTILLPGP